MYKYLSDNLTIYRLNIDFFRRRDVAPACPPEKAGRLSCVFVCMLCRRDVAPARPPQKPSGFPVFLCVCCAGGTLLPHVPYKKPSGFPVFYMCMLCRRDVAPARPPQKPSGFPVSYICVRYATPSSFIREETGLQRTKGTGYPQNNFTKHNARTGFCM